MKIQAAIIGCGRAAGGYDRPNVNGSSYNHAGAYRLFPEVELVAAADPDAARLALFGKSWDIRCLYTDTAELLRRHRVGVVSVCVPDAFHESVILQLLNAQPPKVIFAEKPLAMDSKAARALLASASRAGSRIILNNQRRWEVGHQRVRELIRSGEIGQVVTVMALYVRGLYHIGCTVVDTIRFLISEIDAVRAVGQAQEGTLSSDPSMDAVLYLRNEATAVMLGADRCGYRYSVFELDILGTTGRVRISENGDRIILSRAHPDPRDPNSLDLREDPGEIISSEMGTAIPNGVRQIVRFLAKQEELLDQTGEEGYLDLCVLDAIAASKSRQGATVAVSR